MSSHYAGIHQQTAIDTETGAKTKNNIHGVLIQVVPQSAFVINKGETELNAECLHVTDNL